MHAQQALKRIQIGITHSINQGHFPTSSRQLAFRKHPTQFKDRTSTILSLQALAISSKRRFRHHLRFVDDDLLQSQHTSSFGIRRKSGIRRRGSRRRILAGTNRLRHHLSDKRKWVGQCITVFGRAKGGEFGVEKKWFLGRSHQHHFEGTLLRFPRGVLFDRAGRERLAKDDFYTVGTGFINRSRVTTVVPHPSECSVRL